MALGTAPGGNPNLTHRLTTESISTRAISNPGYLLRRVEMLMSVADDEARIRHLPFQNVVMGPHDGWDKPTRDEMYQLIRMVRSAMNRFEPGVKLIVRASSRRAEYIRERGIRNARSHRLHVRPGPSPNTTVFLWLRNIFYFPQNCARFFIFRKIQIESSLTCANLKFVRKVFKESFIKTKHK